jgi:hypothetical protein
VIPTDDKLNTMRMVCDPVVDEVIARYFASASKEDVGALMHTLFRQGVLPAAHPLVARYTAALDGWPEPPIGATVARGQRLFELYGPEILLTLGSYAVPLAYAAANGVQVIHRARRLKDDPIRRLCDTAQMVINVMQPGELARGGIGWRSIRHLVAKDHKELDEQGQVKSTPWQAAWGRPINQEDQAGTLLTFSIGTIHGLRLMGAQISKDAADDYLSAWAAVGRLLGVEESLLPVDEIEGAELAKKIGARRHTGRADVDAPPAGRRRQPVPVQRLRRESQPLLPRHHGLRRKGRRDPAVAQGELDAFSRRRARAPEAVRAAAAAMGTGGHATASVRRPTVHAGDAVVEAAGRPGAVRGSPRSARALAHPAPRPRATATGKPGSDGGRRGPATAGSERRPLTGAL